MIGISEDYRRINPNDLIGSTIRWHTWLEDQSFVIERFIGETLFGIFYSDLYPEGNSRSFSLLNGITKKKNNYTKGWYIIEDMRNKEFNLQEDLFEL